MNEAIKQENEIKVSREFAERIKKRWEELAERQEAKGYTARSGRKITEVSFVKDHHGKIAVQIGLRNGKSIRDSGRGKAVEKFKEQNDNSYMRSRVAFFLKKIREYGYAAVEGEIPEELKEAVLNGMEKADISTSYRGTRAEAAEKNAQTLLKNMDTPRANDGFVLFADSQDGRRPYAVRTTPEMEKAAARGVTFILPSLLKDLGPEIVPLIEKTATETLDTAARMTENVAVSTIQQNRIGSESVTAVTADGRKITGAAIELASKDIAQQAFLRLLDKPRDKYTENDKKLESFMLSTLKHKGIVAKDAAEIPADKINAAKEYVSQHVAELPSRRAAAFFPEDLKRQYQAAKAKEREIRAERDNNPERQAERKKIKDAMANTPTLLSEIIGGKRKSTDYSFSDVMQDLRQHPKSEDRMMMARLLHLSVQNDPKLTKESKIPQECMQKNVFLLKKYKIKAANEPQLNFQKFLEREGLVSRKQAPEKSAAAEAGRVSDKLRNSIRRQENTTVRRTSAPVKAPVQTKATVGEKKKQLTTAQIALIQKRKNDFAR